MSGQIHQLFVTDADLLAAWDRYAQEAREIAANPALLADRAAMDRMLAAEAEYKRLFNLSLERGRQ